jgi:molybdopterin-containing oxidoreductase family membrane subunit
MMSRETRQELINNEMLYKFRGLLIIFSLAVLYFTAAHHITKIYAAGYRDVEHFLLLGGGMYTTVFWLGHVVIGNLLPLAILFYPSQGRTAWHAIAVASLLFLVGGVANMFVTIIAAQAYPLNLFPGMEVTSTFGDGSVAQYWPSTPEILLGISGVSIAMLLTGVALKVLPFLPRSHNA